LLGFTFPTPPYKGGVGKDGFLFFTGMTESN
jgi:hypothetical protein